MYSSYNYSGGITQYPVQQPLQHQQQQYHQQQQQQQRTGPMYSDGNDGGYDDGNGGGIWGTAVSWAKYAGGKVVEAEAEVWRRVNGK